MACMGIEIEGRVSGEGNIYIYIYQFKASPHQFSHRKKREGKVKLMANH